jgi:hypothetical protein
MSLIDKLRATRESSLTAGGHTWTLRRPTDAEAVRLRDASALDLVHRYVIGWDLREIDLIPGGSPVPLPFDADLWVDWVADQPHLWEPISSAVIDAYLAHQRAREDAAKN